MKRPLRVDTPPEQMHPQALDVRAGVRPIIVQYMRGKLTDEQLMEQLLRFAYTPYHNPHHMSQESWWAQQVYFSSDPSSWHEVSRAEAAGRIPTIVFNRVAHELGWCPPQEVQPPTG